MMVVLGQSARSDLDRIPIEQVPFAPPLHPHLGLELMTLAELRRRVPAHHRHVRSRPAFHQLMLIESGSTEHDIDFIRHRCPAGSALRLYPGQVQRFVRDAPAEGWVLLFDPEFLPPEPLLDAPHGLRPQGAVLLNAPIRKRVARIARALQAAYDGADGDSLSTQMLRHLLLALLMQIALAQNSGLPRPAQRVDGLAPVYRRFLVELDARHAITRQVADYAGRIGCSSKTLVRACHALSGETPKALIEERVALEAKRLLVHSPSSVASVGASLGFAEATNFVKFFRRVTGLTPSAFRAQQSPEQID